MQHRRLGRTDIDVSAICLGTMTWGEQNSEAEAHAQLDLALDRGVNFIDTAEIYPVPPTAETFGTTERYLGSWIAQRRNRSKVVIATKVAGANNGLPYVRDGGPRLDRKSIAAALDASLKRLRTDYVDLYQTHSPDRPGNYFNRPGYAPPADQGAPLEETLGVLGDLQRAGKIRAFGVSNETPWGLMRCLALADAGIGPRVASIQNAYNLLNRTFEGGLAEIASREDCGLLAYSPLAMAVLTGKYLDGRRPPGARLTRYTRFVRYNTRRAEPAAAAYVALANAHGLDPAQMAIAFVASRPFVTATIVGATSLEQLAQDIGAIDLALAPQVLAGIEAIHADSPNPCP